MNKKIIILMVLLLVIPISYASITISHTCSDSRCTEGLPINYSVWIGNNINQTVTINYIKIKDVATELNYVSLNDLNAVLAPNESRYFNFTDITPAPFDGGYTARYIACFGVTGLNREELVSIELCSKSINSLATLPLDKIECRQNKECSANQYCDTPFLKCRELICENGFALNQQCISYFVPVLILLALLSILYLLVATSKSQN